MIFLPYSLLAHLLVTLGITTFGLIQSSPTTPSTIQQQSSIKVHPINEFTSYSIIEPQFYNPSGVQLSSDSFKTLPCSEFHRLAISFHNKTFTLDLKENIHLIPNNYFESIHLNGSPIIHQKHQIKPSPHCHFHGSLSNDADSFSALSIFKGKLSGIISSTNQTFHIHFDKSTSKHLLFDATHYKNANNFRCGVEDPTATTNSTKHQLSLSNFHRRKRSTDQKIPYRANSKTRYVELVLVNDHKEFIQCGRSKEAVIEKSKQIANIVNALYNQLNIFVALVGVVIWSDFDEITLSSNGDTTLTNFLRYRKERLVPKHPNDNAQLITGTAFDAGVVGKALKGPICTYEFSGGVNTDHSEIISLVATTVAHELGHNFGMEHDTTECECKNAEKCIMSHSSGPYSPKKWSSCSIKYLNDAFSRGMDFCLKNEPRQIIGPVCGNGFTEEGEECDCGMKEFCDNPCCDSSTCKLQKGAKCAIGSCCDLQTCTLVEAKKQQVCRPASGECDFEEFCDGTSELCPEDLYVQDGTECGSEEAFCLNGTCSSYNSQCKLLWGESGAVSASECFEQNRFGKPSGNCGFNRINKTYIPCKELDNLCGMLHCTHANERLEFGMYSAAILHKTLITQGETVLACNSAVIDLGLDTVDPGLVPNGAKCGEAKMCLNQRCVGVEKIRQQTISCPNDCSRNGYCDNKGICHCMKGFREPDCEQPLPKWYHLTLAMYIIFLVIIPLTGFSAFIAFYFNSNIKTWWILRARKANIKSRAKKSTISKVQHLPPHMDLKSLKISGPLMIDSNSQSAITSTTPLNNTNSTTTNPSTTMSNVNSNGNIPWAQSVNSSRTGSINSVKPLRSSNSVHVTPPRPSAPPPSVRVINNNNINNNHNHNNNTPARPAPPPPPTSQSSASSPSPSSSSSTIKPPPTNATTKPSSMTSSRPNDGNDLSRSTSLRSSSRANLERPKHPPPKPPPIDSNEDNSSSDSSNEPPPNKNDLQRPLMRNISNRSDGGSSGRATPTTPSIGPANFAARLAVLQASFNASHTASSSSSLTPRPSPTPPPQLPPKPKLNSSSNQQQPPPLSRSKTETVKNSSSGVQKTGTTDKTNR